MIWQIAKKECHANLISLRFTTGTVLLLALGPSGNFLAETGGFQLPAPLRATGAVARGIAEPGGRRSGAADYP